MLGCEMITLSWKIIVGKREYKSLVCRQQIILSEPDAKDNDQEKDQTAFTIDSIVCKRVIAFISPISETQK